MTKRLLFNGGRQFGKLERSTIENVVYAHLGASNESVIQGPRIGFDNAFVSLGDDKVLVVSTDPISVVPNIGMHMSAWLSVHLIASDLATSGVAPQFASFSINFPPELNRNEKEEYLRSLGTTCREIGVAIVSGHTGTYPGASFTVVGGGTMFGLTRMGEYLDPSMANVGDSILLTKGAAIEATATLAGSFPNFTEVKIGKKLATEAKLMLRSCTTVREALQAKSFGLGASGVTSMHDATEGGVLGGLHEMANASKKGFYVDLEKIFVSKETSLICEIHEIDPFTSLSEGALLITCNPAAVEPLRQKILQLGIRVDLVGSVRGGKGLWTTRGERRFVRTKPGRDQYWMAYNKCVAAGLD